jgi:hypothetical protein
MGVEGKRASKGWAHRLIAALQDDTQTTHQARDAKGLICLA